MERHWAHRIVSAFAVLVSLLMAPAAFADFTIYYYQDGRSLRNIDQAQALIDSTAPVAVTVSDTINIRESNTSSGNFLGSSTVVPLTSTNNFAVFATGTFFVETAGEFTFNSFTDDGFSLSIDGNVIQSFAGRRGPRSSTTPNIFLSEGFHTLEALFFENTGRSALEISYAEGNFNSFSSANFSLVVGSTPEPASWALMIIAFMGTSLRLKAMRRQDKKGFRYTYTPSVEHISQ